MFRGIAESVFDPITALHSSAGLTPRDTAHRSLFLFCCWLLHNINNLRSRSLLLNLSLPSDEKGLCDSHVIDEKRLSRIILRVHSLRNHAAVVNHIAVLIILNLLLHLLLHGLSVLVYHRLLHLLLRLHHWLTLRLCVLLLTDNHVFHLCLFHSYLISYKTINIYKR